MKTAFFCAIVAGLLASACTSSSTTAVVVGASTAATCTGAGMSCTAISECAPGKGHLTTLGSCGNPSLACCVPAAACPAEDFECCDQSARFRPSCDDGKLSCGANQARCP